MFDDAELRAIRERLPNLSDEKQERLDQAIAGLSSAPLLARLRTALETDSVPYTESEFAVVRRMRKARNDFVHGRLESVPDRSDSRLVMAFLGRILAHRVATLAELKR